MIQYFPVNGQKKLTLSFALVILSFTFATPVEDIPEDAMNIILHGGSPGTTSAPDYLPSDFVFDLGAEGIVSMLKRWYDTTTSEKIRQWAEGFMTVDVCQDCEGYRIKKRGTLLQAQWLAYWPVS